jgi:arabinan endo-1,5-alpha-L-arabinosidase
MKIRVFVFAAHVSIALATSLFAQTTPAADVPAQRRQFPPPCPGCMPFVHDPSTIIRSDRLYYVFTTGRGIPILSSPDGVNWTRQGSVFQQIPDSVHSEVPKNNGLDVWAPDIIRIKDQFFLYYSISSWGSFNSAVALATNPTLNPKDPNYKWTDGGVVVRSDGAEDLNAIDPGVILTPEGTLWICYGSYHGTIQLIQLDPKTGLRIKPDSPVTIIATESEASDIISHDGFFYLFVNHGSCCQGKNSTYNIRVGRSRTVTGPYLDRYGDPLTKAPGNLFLAAHDHRIGPGHFGRIIEDGIERFSLHYEADLSNGGRPTLGFRPLLWSTDGWPVAADNIDDGQYQIVLRKTENNLTVHLLAPSASAPQIAVQSADLGKRILELARYLAVDQQKWTITPVPGPATGGFYKILNLATGDALQIADGQVGLAAYTGADNQLWRLEQFPDGLYRIRSKFADLVLAVAPDNPNATIVTPFAPDDWHKWTIAAP